MLEAYGQTDVGRRRKLNEDAFLIAAETNLYVVCDGMGGHNAGEVASELAVRPARTESGRWIFSALPPHTWRENR